MQISVARMHSSSLALILFSIALITASFLSLIRTNTSHIHQDSYVPPPSNRLDINMNAGWKFLLGDTPDATNPTFDDSSWNSLDLPHTWNNLDGQIGGRSYYRGIGWYRKHFTVDSSYNERRFFLQFDGANSVTDVSVNGHFVGEHAGGYSTFRFDITAYLIIGSDNLLAVKVSNAYNTNVAPLYSDFVDYTLYGGLYRTVHLIISDKLHMLMTDYGSSGLYLKQSLVSAQSAHLQLTALIFNDYTIDQPVTLNSFILDANNTIITTLTSQQTVKAASPFDFIQTTVIFNPHLWNGKSDPYLYHVSVQLQIGNTVTDLVVQPLGFRFFRLDANQGFFLNGHYLDLHGVGMHQDHMNKGWATSTDDIDQDFGFIQEIGANALRLAHYAHNQHIYDLTDSSGIVVWSEIPLIGTISTTANFATIANQQLLELIRQNYNHPSVIFWGLANELHTPPDPEGLLDKLNNLAHTEDPTRITTVASCCMSTTTPLVMHTDTRGYNEYFGWYGPGDPNHVGAWAASLHNKNPDLTFALSEYGAGGSIYQHQDNSAQPANLGQFHPEEYEATLHEKTWKALANLPYVWGKFAWNMFDFSSARRDEGDTIGRNDKGLVTYDRLTRKDAFYWYKANWSNSPFVYITDRRYTHRTLATTDIKIYANTDSVTLLLNGRSLGSKTSTDHIFTWQNVTLSSGNNTVEAIGTLNGAIYNDTAAWTFDTSTRINAGARMPYIDSQGHFLDVDHYVTGGTPGLTTTMIADTSDQSEFQTYREGTFDYAIPLENGNYTLYLKFMEPEKKSCGSRVFNVTAQNILLLNDEDIYCEVGQNVATQKIFTVSVSSGLLNLHFTPSVDNAIVSAINLVKH